jgi:hypothetical protein
MLAGLLVVGCPKKNHAPDAPSAPSGPSAVGKDSLASFSSSATDPDGDSVSIRFDWGDGDTSAWSQYVESDELVAMSHAWSALGICSMRSQARDQSSLTSAWSPAQVVDITAAGDTWSKTFGGANFDDAYSVQQTSDGGYIIAGKTGSYGAGDYDVWLVKTDEDGNKVWDRTFGKTTSEHGWSVQQTSDGGYVIAGYTYPHATRGWDALLIKTDLDGNEVWEKTYGGEEDDYGYSVRQTSDGGYVVTGSTVGGNWLIKTDANGNMVWDRTFGGSGAYSVQQTSDSGYVMVGETWSNSAGGSDVWLVKTDAAGSKEWDRTFGGADMDVGRSVQQTSDGGYIIAGWTNSYGAGDYDFWLVKVDPVGNKTWDRTFGGASWDQAWSVHQTSDGGYIVTGVTDSRGASYADVWLIRTDADGNKVWDRNFGGENPDFGYSVQQTSDGGYIVTGSTHSYGAGETDVWLIKAFGP